MIIVEAVVESVDLVSIVEAVEFVDHYVDRSSSLLMLNLFLLIVVQAVE